MIISFLRIDVQTRPTQNQNPQALVDFVCMSHDHFLLKTLSSMLLLFGVGGVGTRNLVRALGVNPNSWAYFHISLRAFLATDNHGLICWLLFGVVITSFPLHSFSALRHSAHALQ